MAETRTADRRRTIGVVLCDDMPDLRELTRYGLEQDLRLRVLGEAGSAAECFAIVERLAPDALLLDLTLPDMDGLEAIPGLRELAPDLSIIVFSGMDAGRMEGRALARGADAYVEKGSSLSEIRKVVLRAVRGRGLEIGPSIPLELRAPDPPVAMSATGGPPDEVSETLDELDRLVDRLAESPDEASVAAARSAIATLRRRLAD